MRLVKDGRAVELSNEAHIHAYKASGWVEQAAEQPKAAKPRARKPKAAE